MKSINVKDFVGTNAISMNSGRKINAAIVKEWNNTDKIILEFSGVDVFASPFFNASIGTLLKDRSIAQLQQKLVFNGVSDHGKRLLNLVIENAIKFYSSNNNEKTEEGLTEANKEF